MINGIKSAPLGSHLLIFGVWYDGNTPPTHTHTTRYRVKPGDWLKPASHAMAELAIYLQNTIFTWKSNWQTNYDSSDLGVWQTVFGKWINEPVTPEKQLTISIANAESPTFKRQVEFWKFYIVQLWAPQFLKTHTFRGMRLVVLINVFFKGINEM